MKKNLITSFLFALCFFIISFFTLKDYCISWDEPLHFMRGQAYLHYYLTGLKNYNDLPKVNLRGTDGQPENVPSPRRSFYQDDVHNGEFSFKDDIGHPPLNDQIAALSNLIFYQKLGLLDDISAHHLFNILASSVLVFTVCLFMLETFGLFSALIAMLSLITYPLFFSEAHFNIKDPPEAAFLTTTILFFYLSAKNWNIKNLILSAVFFFLALGTKFNILFTPFIVIPYLLVRSKLTKKIVKPSKKYLLLLISIPFITLILLFICWPFLWSNPLPNMLSILKFYKDIGTGNSYQPTEFTILGFNSYPLQWIFFTTPPLVLGLSLIGIVSAWLNRKKFQSVTILWFLMLAVPIIRVSLPGSVIYGGDRQIMEFIPAMAMIAGLGANQLVEWLKDINPSAVKITILGLFIFPITVLFHLHPNENVYFNFFIDGLKGAQEKNFPSWGNSFGNAYCQGIDWLNKNAEKGAKLSLIQGTPANAPAIYIRSDIQYDLADKTNKRFFSSNLKKGEYLMELTYNDTSKSNEDVWYYVKNSLRPIYEVSVEDVAILKVWKNDSLHTR